jgi:DNA-binding transcriptional ArsR family regulator
MPLREAPVAIAKAELFKALGHPIRVRVLELLTTGERPVGELAELLDVEISHLSQQLGVLRRAQVVTARRERSTVFYSLRDPRMSQLLAVAKQLLVTELRNSHALLIDLEESDVGSAADLDAVGASNDSNSPTDSTSDHPAVSARARGRR